MGHLDPDLMMPPCMKVDLGQGTVSVRFQNPVSELCFLCVTVSLFRDPGAVCPVISYKPVRKSDHLPSSFLRLIFGLFIRKHHDRLINLAHICLSGYLSAQFSGSPGCFRENKKTFNRLVKAVNDTQIRFPPARLSPARVLTVSGSGGCLKGEIILQFAYQILPGCPADPDKRTRLP